MKADPPSPVGRPDPKDGTVGQLVKMLDFFDPELPIVVGDSSVARTQHVRQVKLIETEGGNWIELRLGRRGEVPHLQGGEQEG